MTSIKKVLIVTVIITISFALLTIFRNNTKYQMTKTVIINNKTIVIEIADTENLRRIGLSGRTTLDKNTGMLFVFDQAGIRRFWMKDMKIALDFLWFNEDSVVEMDENILPPSRTNNIPATISPVVPSKYVLELNSGFIKEHSIHIGDKVEFNL
ncbi:MAG: DUF192 domain-containing protein [bacterium]|nr:DUF192 domain-containing protein [bacterium]